jgi:hypothetical protein
VEDQEVQLMSHCAEITEALFRPIYTIDFIGIEGMVGASGFEPPTSWSRTRKILKMNDLALGIAVEMGFDMLFHLKKLKRIRRSSFPSRHTVSMRGVGIVLGIVAGSLGEEI